MQTATPLRRAGSQAAMLAMLAAVGVAALMLALTVAEASLKTRLAVCAALAFPVAARFYPRVKDLLLFAWVVSLTYNRQYFSFEGITGNIGTQGPYWIVADIFFFALLALWWWESAVLKRRTVARGSRLWPWFVPMTAACLFSVAVAQRPDWSLYECIRLVKFGLVLWYVRHNFGRREWWIAVAALGFAMTAQSLIGAKEIITGRSGVLGLSDPVTGLAGHEDIFKQENFYGWVRATGTMNHPPNLACYLILVIPVFLCLGLAARRRPLRLLSLGVFLAGCVGLGCTLSRWPWALAAGEIGLALAAMVWLRETRPRFAAGLALAGLCGLSLVLIPLREKFMDRLTRDFSESVDQRQEGNRVAIAMIQERPWLGVGLNNSKLHILKYMPELQWAIDAEDVLTQQVKSRSLAAMGNGFFFVTAETGVVGTLAFLVCLAGAAAAAVRALRGTRGIGRAVVAGLSLGLLGVLLQQVVDFSLWVDPLLYTVALCIGLLDIAPAVTGEARPA